MPADLREALDGAAPRHVPGLDFDQLWRRHRRAQTRRVVTGAVAALAAVLVAGSVIQWGPTVEVAPVAPAWPDTPEGQARAAEAIAEAYIEARNAYDPERARELVSEDFMTDEFPDGYRNLETMELAFEMHQAWGFHYSDVDCGTQSATPQGVQVSCDSLWTTVLHGIGDHPPTPADLIVVVEDGRITRVGRGPGHSLSFWDPWMAFLRAEHPEFYTLVDRSLDLEPATTREVSEQLPRYLELYEERVNTQQDSG